MWFSTRLNAYHENKHQVQLIYVVFIVIWVYFIGIVQEKVYSDLYKPTVTH